VSSVLFALADRIRNVDPAADRKYENLPFAPLAPQQNSMTPKIIQLPTLHLLGLSVRFIPPVSPDAGNLEVIPKLYDRFCLMLHSLPLQQDKYIYGAARSPADAKRSHPDELEYLASVNVDPGVEPKEPLELWTISAGTYACFTHHGPLADLSETINYAFGTWLPRSSYVPTGGPNLDRQDERFGFGGKDSEFDFLIPVKPKWAGIHGGPSE